MSPDSSLIVNKRHTKVSDVTIADKTKAPVSALGDVYVQAQNPKHHQTIKLHNVLHVLDIAFNLLSISAMTKRVHKELFDGPSCRVYDQKDNIIMEGLLSNSDVYRVQFTQPTSDTQVAPVAACHRCLAQTFSTFKCQLHPPAPRFCSHWC